MELLVCLVIHETTSEWKKKDMYKLMDLPGARANKHHLAVHIEKECETSNRQQTSEETLGDFLSRQPLERPPDIISTA